MKTEKRKMNSLISWLCLAYFLILAAERVQSLVRAMGEGWKIAYGNGFFAYVNTLAILSLAGAAVLLIGFNGNFWRSLFDPSVAPDYTMLSVTVGVILLSGMVHTEYTVAPVQFGAYGALILAMILRTVEVSGTSSSKATLWYSIVYLTVFSMAIPVVYRSFIERATLFHIIEAVVSVALVVAFTYLLRLVFVGQGENLLFWAPILIAVVGDAILLWMRWNEEINTFVLIFASASAALFAVGKVLFRILR